MRSGWFQSGVPFSLLLCDAKQRLAAPGGGGGGGVGGGEGSSRGTRLHGAGAQRRWRKLGRKIPSGRRRGKAPRFPAKARPRRHYAQRSEQRQSGGEAGTRIVTRRAETRSSRGSVAALGRR